MWLGMLVALFSDHEFRLLQDVGYLSQHDLDLLRQSGRTLTEPGTPRRAKGDGDEDPLVAIPARTHVPPVG